MTANQPAFVLIDDNTETQQFIQTLIEYNGFSITIFGTATEAINALRTHKSAPDLIILDLYLPDSDGYETFGVLKQILPETPVVATTAYYDETTDSKTHQTGFKALLTKPYKSALFMETLRDALNAN